MIHQNLAEKAKLKVIQEGIKCITH